MRHYAVITLLFEKRTTYYASEFPLVHLCEQHFIEAQLHFFGPVLCILGGGWYKEGEQEFFILSVLLPLPLLDAD